MDESLRSRAANVMIGRVLGPREVAALVNEPVPRVQRCLVKLAREGVVVRARPGVYARPVSTVVPFDRRDDERDEFLTCYDDGPWRERRFRDGLVAE